MTPESDQQARSKPNVLKSITKLTDINFPDFERNFFKFTVSYGGAHDWLNTGNKPDYKEPSLGDFCLSNGHDMTQNSMVPQDLMFLWQKKYEDCIKNQNKFQRDCQDMWTLLQQAMDEEISTKVEANSK